MKFLSFFKKIIKNKKASSVIVAVVLIPVIIATVFGIAFINMSVSANEKKMITVLNNNLFYVSKTYGSIRSDKDGNKFCVFIPSQVLGVTDSSIEITESTTISNKNSFAQEFKETIQKCDGYNSLWKYKIKIERNTDHRFDDKKNINNMYVTIELKIVLPRELKETAFGTENGTSGWYYYHNEVWEAMKSNYEKGDYREFIIIDNIIATGSCV